MVTQINSSKYIPLQYHKIKLIKLKRQNKIRIKANNAIADSN